MKHNNYLQWFHKIYPLAFHSSYRILHRFTAISPRIEIEIDMVNIIFVIISDNNRNKFLLFLEYEYNTDNSNIPCHQC